MGPYGAKKLRKLWRGLQLTSKSCFSHFLIDLGGKYFFDFSIFRFFIHFHVFFWGYFIQKYLSAGPFPDVLRVFMHLGTYVVK